jgi:N-methylhydantoinase A
MRFAIDTGGTHTDVVMLDSSSGKITVEKVPTTSHNLILGIQAGILSLTEAPESVDEFFYATTQVTNMIVQQKAFNAGMLTTKGFRDILEIGRASRTWNIYDIQRDRTPPLIPRSLRLGVTERIDFKGNIIEPLNETEVVRAAEKLLEEGINSIAVMFLHSYRNPIHENRVKEILSKRYPQLMVSLSSEISAEFREYERASTTALNAFAQPVMTAHLDALEKAFRNMKMESQNYTMQCNGGLTSFSKIKQRPIMAASSGPIAGVLAGKYFANEEDITDMISFDVGGTSTDISIIKDNQIPFTIESELEHHPLQIPLVEFTTIGSGGGSIIWIDSGGALRVGPVSAGADPGPVCYDKGGEDPTTTDAMLLCGIIHPKRYLGGKAHLNLERANRIFEKKLAEPLGLSVPEAAVQSIRVAISNIVEGIKSVSVAKGLDPRDFALVAFGGAGPMFASFVARELESPVIVIPPRPGITSAFGLLMTDIKEDFVINRICLDTEITHEEITGYYEELEQMAHGENNYGASGRNIHLFRSMDLRYFGQSFELNIPVSSARLSAPDIDQIRTAFFQKHRQIYGHFFEDKQLQYVKFRVTAIEEKDRPDLSKINLIEPEPGERIIEKREVFLPEGETSVSVCDRNKINQHEFIDGPAIIEQMDSTILLLPQDRCRVSRSGSLIIHRGK